MLTCDQKQKLMKNWGERADSLECLAEVRVFDPLSSWECYIYAMNPDDQDEISCILNGFELEVSSWSMKSLQASFNEHGEHPIIDLEYRPRQAFELFKILNERKRKWRQ